MNFDWNSEKIRAKLKELRNVEKINIATAYISKDGVEILKEIISNNNVSKEDTNIFLRTDFAMEESYEIAVDLFNIANVYVLNNLHAKVYLITTAEDETLIFGSANLTKNGTTESGNIEFFSIEKLEKDNKVKDFFEFLKEEKNSLKMDEELISKYKENYYNNVEEMKKSEKIINKSKNQIKSFINEKLTKNLLNLEDISKYFFTEEDYETFSSVNCIKPKFSNRKKIQEKLLEIDEEIKNELLKKYGLEHHWKENNVSTSIVPNKHNHWKVDWMGIRYALNIEKIKSISKFRPMDVNDDSYGMTKYSTMQYNLCDNGFEICLCQSNYGGFDGEWLIQHLEEIKLDIEREISKLRGLDLKWKIGSENEFNVDEESPQNFVKYLKKQTKDTRSIGSVKIQKNDMKLSSKEEIKKVIIEIFDKLLPLYRVMREFK